MEADKAQKSLLFVEDDPVIMGIMEKIIRMKFPDVDLILAENGSIGLDLYKAHLPNLVVTDVNMPVMNGIEMAAGIRRINPQATIIVISAYSNREYLLDSIEIGIQHYILKPIEFNKFFALIDKCMKETDPRLNFQGSALASEA